MLLLLSFFLLFFSMYFLLFNLELIFEWNIISFNSMKLNMFLIMNYKILLFIFLVMFISSMIFIYSMNYMNLNSFLLKRFYYLMMLFLFSMIMLILSPNMLTIMLGWDGLGLISYCLIIYYNKLNSFNSGMMTIILNRLGDTSLLMIISFLSMFGSWNLIIYNMNNFLMLMLIIMIFTKSAQFPFFVWLPMAMMAPTPVSSLVHSSTLVTAGIYLMVWYENLFSLKYKNFILFISSLTMLISGLMANFEMDFKKIIAFSTLSQLGFMLSILCLNLNNLTFLHLFIHALFKSMMFMCVGSFIHYMNGIQNFRFYKGMFYIYPMKSIIFMFSLMMLCGFPFLVGFYSKDLMIEIYFLNKMMILCLFFLMFSTMLTISYSFRIMMNFFDNKLMLNMIYYYEDKLMNYCMMFMMMLMLLLSKIMYNFNFMIMNLNLLKIYKYFIIKMFILGFILNLIFNKINFKKILILLKNFFYMINMYKMIVYYFNKFLNKYELIYEKMFYEIIFSNFSMLLSLLNLNLMFNKMSLYMIILMYMYLIMIFILY
nr:NADH dehydrogenase subunit 5 [Tetragonisca angustula]